MPQKRCAWGCCNSDSRYKDRPHMQNVTFIRFPQPKTQPERCLKWIRACNRPHYQLNIDKITYYHFVCSKHFTEGSIDPVSASISDKPLKRRRSPKNRECHVKRRCVEVNRPDSENDTGACATDTTNQVPLQDITEALNFSVDGQLPDFSVLLEEDQQQQQEQIQNELKCHEQDKKKHGKKKTQTSTCEYVTDICCNNCGHSVQVSDQQLKKLQRQNFIKEIEKNDKNCFFYTGVPTSAVLHYLFSWISPSLCDLPLWYGSNRFVKKKKNITRTSLTHYEEFLLTLVRIRRGIDIKYTAFQFGISPSQASRVFIAWVHFLDECFSPLIFWPPKDLVSKICLNHLRLFQKLEQ